MHSTLEFPSITLGQKKLHPVHPDKTASQSAARGERGYHYRQEPDRLGESHQAGRKLDESKSIFSLQPTDSIRVQNNRGKTKINEF